MCRCALRLRTGVNSSATAAVAIAIDDAVDIGQQRPADRHDRDVHGDEHAREEPPERRAADDELQTADALPEHRDERARPGRTAAT